MFTTGQTLRAFFSGACVCMLLASIVSAQDKPSSEPGSVGPAALPILNLNPLAQPAPEKTSVEQGGLFDSWIGVVGAWTIFDFFKRERTIKERGAQVTMAKANLEMVRAKVAAEALKTVMDVDRIRRILELTRRVASMQRAMTRRDQAPGPEARAALAKAEAEMFRAELDYRMAYAQMKRADGEQ